MGLFASARQVFDGRTGSPIEDWLRQQGIMGGQTAGIGAGARPQQLPAPASANWYTGDISAAAPAEFPTAAPRQRGMFGRRPPSTVASVTPNDATEALGPNYAAHYQMHGRDENGDIPKPHRNFGQKLLSGLGNFAMAYSASQGNPVAQYQMQLRMKQRAGQADAEAKFHEHNALVQNLMQRGIPAEDAELYALAPDKLGEELNSRFRTRETSPGETIYTPEIGDGAPATWRAPEAPTAFQNNVGWLEKRGVNPRFVDRAIEREFNPEQWVTPPAGGFSQDVSTRVPLRSRLGGAGGGASVPGSFNEIAGPGTTGRPSGGRSYQDPGYDHIEGGLEQEYGLPPGLMNRIRTRGERSNADQVSEAGARSVYQVIPETRNGFVRQYGIDAYAGPEDAARVAALHLRDSYNRTGSWDRAVTEYHGGTDPRKWGPRTRAYRQRVTGAGGSAGGSMPRVTSPGDVAGLPSGTQFIAPDGSIRRKP